MRNRLKYFAIVGAQHVLPLVLGALFGLVIMAGTPLYAQGIIHVHADPQNNCQYVSGEASISLANAVKVTAAFDGAQPIAVVQACTGSGPIQCAFPVPMAMQTIGLHSLVVTGTNQTTDPVDGSVLTSTSTTLATGQYQVDPLPTQPPAPAPPPAGNGQFKIIKIVGGFVLALLGLFELFHK